MNFNEQFTGIPEYVFAHALIRGCDICEKEFELTHYKDGHRMCPECIDRMHKVLYPELHNCD